MEGEGKKRKFEEEDEGDEELRAERSEERAMHTPTKRHRVGDEAGDDDTAGQDNVGEAGDDEGVERSRRKGKGKARGPSGKFQQTFSEDADFGVTDFKGSDKLDAEEEAEGEASLVDIGRYKIKGVGTVEVEPFNLKEERSEGYFDEKGHFVYKRKDPNRRERGLGESEESSEEEGGNVDDEQADAWMQDISTYATTKKVTFAPDVKDNEKVVEKIDLLALKKEAVKHLLPGETVSKALIRLGNQMKAAKAAGRGKGRGRGKGSAAAQQKKAEGDAQVEDVSEAKKSFDLLTEAASKLMDEGWTNIYQYTLDQLRRLIKQEEAKKTGGEAQEAIEQTTDTATTTTTSQQEGEGQGGGEQVMWEYKTGPDDEQVFGSFPSAAMADWRTKGYIDGAVVRRVGDNTAFIPLGEADFSV